MIVQVKRSLSWISYHLIVDAGVIPYLETRSPELFPT